MTEVMLEGGVGRIGREEYAPFADQQHLFLVGDLRKPNPHPFVRDARLELIVCFYEPGDDGAYHWHRDVTEYEVITEGTLGYFEAASGEIRWFGPGDCCVIAPGTCVRRLVREPVRTVAIKVPSSSEKVHCAGCPRDCRWRVAPYSGS